MRTIKLLTGLFTFLMVGAISLTAQTDIISAEDFKTLLKENESLVVIDANKAKTYQASHVKGAVNIYHNDLYQDGDISGLIKSPEELAAIFGANGVTENSKIVIYDDGSQKYSSRTYWILKYLGATDVSLLHKDMDVWGKIRLPLATTPTRVEAVTFNPDPNADLLATTDYVQANRDNPGVILVDVRTPDEYNGTASNSDGHIPGAVNLNYEELLTDTGAFKNETELAAIAATYGITPDKEVIFYCRTSVRGTVAFVAFRNLLGYDNVKVYDGAYVEWAATNPVVQ